MNRLLRYLMTRTWMSAVGLLVLVLGAAWDYHVTYPGAHSCEFLTTRQGANIELACRVVEYSGVAALLALSVARLWEANFPKDGNRRGVAVLLFLEAGALTLAFGSSSPMARLTSPEISVTGEARATYVGTARRSRSGTSTASSPHRA